MLVLGWHGNPQATERQGYQNFSYHDSAAAILRNGILVAAVEEERLNRVKHSSFFPTRAIRFCLKQAGATFDDLDAIVTDFAREGYEFTIATAAVGDARIRFENGREQLAGLFKREFDAEIESKIRFCNHHTAHFLASWHASRFPHALVVCIDGDGDGASGVIGHCEGSRSTILRTIPDSQSLGNFYTQNLAFLGYQRFDEYKVMGLAPYGDARVHAPMFARMFQLQEEGRFSLASPLDQLLISHEAGLMPLARRKGQPIQQVHMDFAAALQETLEVIVEHIVRHFHRVTNARHLCFTGGVAQNCALNGRLLRTNLFESIYVMPASHDAGNAIGAALSVFQDGGLPIPPKLIPNVFLGPHIGEVDDIGDRLRAWQPLICIERTHDAPRAAAQMLVAGKVLGWVQGRSEFGPRALGNRSILADARPARNKYIVNTMVKKREAYRPFAPAVTQERMREFFEVPAGTSGLPYMAVVVPVLPHARATLGAVTHVDGSARVQTVSATDNPRFHALVAHFGELTGIPVVLNTSFNNNVEPIVDSIDDAVSAFVTTGIEALIIGDWIVRKIDEGKLRAAILDLVPDLAPARKLVCRSTSNGRQHHGIESMSSHYSTEEWTEVSAQMFWLLGHGGIATARERSVAAKLSEESTHELARELLDLWAGRSIVMRPAGQHAS